MNELLEERTRIRLAEMRDRLVTEFRTRRNEAAHLGDGGVPDPGDASFVDDMRDLLLRFTDNERSQVVEIDDALDRLRSGSYGTCERCGEEIDPVRLEAQPFTRYCIECKEDLEAASGDNPTVAPRRGKI